MNVIAARHQYELEKADGTRRPNGATYLKRLNAKHITCIQFALAGVKQGVIAEKMNMTPAWVSMVLSDPLAQEMIQRRFREVDAELMALFPKAVEVLRTSMGETAFVPKPVETTRVVDGVEVEGTLVPVSMETRLSGAEKWFKANGYYSTKDKGAGSVSAEDIVREMLAQTKEGSSTKVSIEVTKGDSIPIIEGSAKPWA